MGDIARAMSTAETIEELPQRVTALSAVGEAQAKAGDRGAARDTLQRAAAAASSHGVAPCHGSPGRVASYESRRVVRIAHITSCLPVSRVRTSPSRSSTASSGYASSSRRAARPNLEKYLSYSSFAMSLLRETRRAEP